MSTKQQKIIDAFSGCDSFTLDQAVALIGRDIYSHSKHRVGTILSDMVKQGYLVRLKPGVFAVNKFKFTEFQNSIPAVRVLDSLFSST